MNPLILRAAVVALVVWRLLVLAAALFTSTLWSDDALCVFINASLVGLPFLLLLAATGRWIWSLAGASALALFVFGMGELKANYFGTRLVLGDWAFISEPTNWTIVGHYPRIYGTLAAFSAGALLSITDAALASRRHKALAVRTRLLALALAIVLSGFLWTQRHHHTWEVWNDDANCGEMYRCGALGRLLYSVAMFEYEPPTHAGDPSLFLAKQAELPASPAAEPVRKPDIVLWLNESTFDPRGFELPGAKLPPMPMFDATPLTRARGPLRVHTFGGKTWLSEFSVLTGLVPDDFGVRRNVVLSSVGPRTNSNLFRELKANGYRTVVLMPTYKRFYGAGRAYEGMGADEVLTLRDFHEYDALPGDEWDIAETDRMAEAAILRIQRQRREAPEQPIFLYLLSIREHAPYKKGTPVDYKLDKAGIPKPLAGRITDYVNRLRKLDTAVGMIDRYLFAKDSPPALYAWFGDHQAYYEGDSPPYRTKLAQPDFITQFQIRSNYPVAGAAALPLTDIAYLPSLISDLAGLQQDDYFKGLSAMRQLCAGLYDECPEKDLLDSYKARVFGAELNLLRP